MGVILADITPYLVGSLATEYGVEEVRAETDGPPEALGSPDGDASL